MESRTVKIINRLGLHARAAAKLVALSGEYTAKITLARDEKEIDTKNIMSVMLLAAGPETELLLKADGPDEEAAINAVANLIADRFGEPE